MNTNHNLINNGSDVPKGHSRGIVQVHAAKGKQNALDMFLSTDVYEKIVAEATRLSMTMPIEDVLSDLNLITPSRAAKLLGVSRSAAYKWCKEGRLPAIEFGDNLRIRPRVLYAFLLAKERLLTEARKAAA